MRRVVVALLLTLAFGLLPARPAAAGGPKMLIGAAEDEVAQSTVVAARGKLELLRLAGFRAVRITSIWQPGLAEPTQGERDRLSTVTAAAQLSSMQVYVSVYNAGSRTTPLSDQDQADFASYAAAIARAYPSITSFIIGNEPNLNRFWLPQFGLDGSDAAATAYLSLLARSYDALKGVSPTVTVIGGALSPRGGDRPGGARQTHSPTAFITDLGAAYRASGRALPIMDEFGIHPYEDNSSIPPSATHPNSTTIAVADYDKLVALLGQAFDGTAQRGSRLSIVYGEFGVETTIPAAKAALYTGSEPATIKPVDPATQAIYYSDAMALAFCQPNVRALFLFHAVDERDLDRWQSGVYYADWTPKISLSPVSKAARDSRGGVIARCPGLALTPTAKVGYPRHKALTSVPLAVRITCDIDCAYRVRLEKLPRHSTTLAARGVALAGTRTLVKLPERRVAPGHYRFTVGLLAPVNTGPPTLLASPPFTIRYNPDTAP